MYFFLFFFDEYEVVEFLARWISVVRQSFWLKAKMSDTGSRQLRLFCSWFFLPLELENIVGVFLPVVQVFFLICGTFAFAELENIVVPELLPERIKVIQRSW